MLQSKNKTTGERLSLVPDHTINLSMEWRASERLSVIPSLTHYGRIKSPRINNQTGTAITNPQDRSAYTIVNLATRYEPVRESRSLGWHHQSFQQAGPA